MTGAALNSQVVRDPKSTRRSKRKADELEKPSLGSSRKRQTDKPSTSSLNPAQTNGSKPTKPNASQATSTKRSARNRKDPKKTGSSGHSLQALNKRDCVELLLERATADSTLLSRLEAQIDNEKEDQTPGEDEDSDVDRGIPEKRPTPSLASPNSTSHQPARVSTRRSSREALVQKDYDDHDDQQTGEFQQEQLEEAEDNENLDDEYDDNKPGDGLEIDCQHPAPTFGESEDEQEVSFNMNTVSPNNLPNVTITPQPTNTPALTAPPLCSPIQNNNLNRASSAHDPAPQMGSSTRVDTFHESVLMNSINSLQRTLTSSMEASFAHVLTEIRADREHITKLREHVSELTSIVTTTAIVMFIKQSSSNPRVKEIQENLCLLPALFNDIFMLKVLSRVVIGFIVTGIEDSSDFTTLVAKGATTRQNALLETTIIEEEETSTVVPTVSAMLQPFWLKPRYVCPEHCTFVANWLEKRGTHGNSDETHTAETSSQVLGDTESTDMHDSNNSSSKQKVNRSGPLTKDEISMEAASMVYKIITSTLYRSRAASKLQLYHDVMYLFSGWKQHGAPVDQTTLKMHWEAPKKTDIDYIDDLPRTKIVKPHDRRSTTGQEVEQADLHNITNIETLISKHPELSLIIDHNVMVKGATRNLRYRVNLLEVACRSLASYTSIESAAKGKDALCVDKKSLKEIVVLSLGLRKLMEEAIDDMNMRNEVPWKENCRTEAKRGRPKRTCIRSATSPNQPQNYKFRSVNSFSIDILLPPPSKQKEPLNQMILNLTEEELDSKMCNVNCSHNSTRGGGSAMVGTQRVRIEADEAQCDFGF